MWCVLDMIKELNVKCMLFEVETFFQEEHPKHGRGRFGKRI